MKNAMQLLAACYFSTQAASSYALSDSTTSCSARSGTHRATVLELYTSEGCSSCPPADKWLSSLKDGSIEPGTVVQAFHVGYWDYIGWVDRFASTAHTERQKRVAALNLQRSIYTPQAVLNGRDWRTWGHVPASKQAPSASIHLTQTSADQFEATVIPLADAPANWSAYWTVTEHDHKSSVRGGENSGKLLQHDFVVRQYNPVGNYPTRVGVAQKLVWHSIPATVSHARQINLVVFDPVNGQPLQAVTAACL